MKLPRNAAIAVAVALCLAACQRTAPEPTDVAAADVSDAADAADASVPAAGSQAPVHDPQPATMLSDTPPSNLNTVNEAAPADAFAGWYFEKNGTAMLLACGQSMPLEVSDPAFLRQLKSKSGGPATPVYVQLAVRPVAGAKLEVAEVRVFGVDEGPAPNCAPMAAR